MSVRAVIRPLAPGLLAAALAGAIAVGAPAHAQAAPVPRVDLPAPTGPYQVGTRALEMVDRSRPAGFGQPGPRRLMVQVTYPRVRGRCRAAPYAPPAVFRELLKVISETRSAEVRTHVCAGGRVAPGRHAVLIFSHAYTADRFVYTALESDLASRGYIVVAPDHTFDAFAVWFPDGKLVRGLFGTPLASKPVSAGTLANLLAVRTADVRFVLSRIESLAGRRGSFLRGHVDRAEVGILGHSLGGATATRAATLDRRIRASANIDGSLFGSWAGRVRSRKPFLLLTSEVLDPAEYRSESLCRYFAHARVPKWALSLPGALHLSYSDFEALAPQIARIDPGWSYAKLYPAVLGTIDPARAIAVQRAAVARFFDVYVRRIGKRFKPPAAFAPIPDPGRCAEPAAGPGG